MSGRGDFISVGKGKVESGKGVVKAAEGKFLVLELVEEKGPCPDNMCQLEAKISGRRYRNICSTACRNFPHS